MIELDLLGTPIQGPPGKDGKDGVGGTVHMVDLAAVEGPEAIGAGSYLMVPIVTDAPTEIMEDEVDIQLPFNQPNARIGLYAKTSPLGVNLIIGVSQGGTIDPQLKPANMTPPAITGGLIEGQTIHVSNGSWSHSPTIFARQWLRNGEAISGATGTTYVLTSDDVGHTIGCSVTATNANGTSDPALATGGGTVLINPSNVIPENVVPPAISGTFVEGQTLAMTNGSWSPTPSSYERQWLRNGTPIGGATGLNYTLTFADVDQIISARVRATNPAGTSEWMIATGGGTVEGDGTITGFPINTIPPTISGSFTVGATLTTTNGSWDVLPDSYEYRWKRSGNIITGATNQNYVPIEGDTGYTISCDVRAHNENGWSAWVASSNGGIITNPQEEDGDDTLYVMPGLMLPFGAIYNPEHTYEINYNTSAVNLKEKRPSDIETPVDAAWDFSSYTAVPEAFPNTDKSAEWTGATPDLLTVKSGSPTSPGNDLMTWDNANKAVIMPAERGLRSSVPLGIQFANDKPKKFKVKVKAKIENYNTMCFELYTYLVANMALVYRWPGGSYEGDTLLLVWGALVDGNYVERNVPLMTPGEMATYLGDFHEYEVEWNNGTINCWVDGVLVSTQAKPSGSPDLTILPSVDININNSIGNFSNSTNMGFGGLEIMYDAPGIAFSYHDIPTGAITPTVIGRLVVDATDEVVRPPSTVTLTNTTTSTVRRTSVIVNEFDVEPGDAYKAILEDWSTGVGIPHANELVMTLPQAQNCRFESETLNYKWFECIPKGPVPQIGDITYHCECIRMGSYSVFQFIYGLDMPTEPFGDPTALNTYMVPHKWKIYDKENNLIDTIERPDGAPLNALDIPNVWEGEYDGRANPMVGEGNWWYPQGTARCSIIWRNRKPNIYTQSEVYENMPVFNARIPFNSYTGFSVNGGDPRLIGTFQQNGYGNWLNTPWEPFDIGYGQIFSWANSANNTDPYGTIDSGPYTNNAVRPNAGLWMKYTPFNICGRSPLTGPGGTRNERQAIPEPVAVYCQDVNGVRHVDQTPLLDIALDYLTSYASEPYHLMENGRCVPLYKGNTERSLAMRYHYYGAGEMSTPPERAVYAMASLDSRASWITETYPIRWNLNGEGIRWCVDPTHPFFGGFGVDNLHAHQFPYWGSSLFKTPEFAMMGNKFTDLVLLYSGGTNKILSENASEWAGRSAAWVHQHAALAWHYGSQNSDRLYSRADSIDWVVRDYEIWAEEYGEAYFNPTSDIWTGGSIDELKLDAYACSVFGMAVKYNDAGDVGYSEFQAGYWLASLFTMKFYGMDDAIRARSSIAGEVFDFMLDAHAERVRQRVNSGFNIPPVSGTGDNQYYDISVWRGSWLSGVTNQTQLLALPHTYAASRAKMLDEGFTADWDKWTIPGNSTPRGRDGQGTDLLLAAPDTLIRMGYNDQAMLDARDICDAAFSQKMNEQLALGRDAGSSWFIYSQTSSQTLANPVI